MRLQLDLSRLGRYETAVTQTITQLQNDDIMARIWRQDHTVWRPDPTEISNRLGWLTAPTANQAVVGQLTEFATAVKADGFSDVLLLGMGGSSLAPEMFAKIYGDDCDGLDLQIVDTTDPDAILAHAQRLDLTKTLFIVATKSGGTVETLSAFYYFYNLLSALLSPQAAGRHFVAITDPGSKLAQMAQTYGFRETFLNDPNVGGRYSALTLFGLLPAALIGVDVATLLQRAETAVTSDIGLQAGALMAACAQAGRDKLTFITSPAILSFGDWAEQLIAESTGKEGKGILPVVGEPVGQPAVYGADRLFVYLRLAGDEELDGAVAELTAAGQPVVQIDLADKYDVAAQLMVWELATAVAGHILDIHPFDQPDVEAAKIMARQMVAAYMETGELPKGRETAVSAANLHDFLSQAQAGDYIAIHAYVQPTAVTEDLLRQLQAQLRDQYQLATTIGYGPRFLHSTGQLHKGDRGNGWFVQVTADARQDVAIPDEIGHLASRMSFGILKQAQALGDAAALEKVNRHLIRFNLGADGVVGLQKLLGMD